MGMSALSGLRKPANLFSGEEIDQLDPAAFAGMSRPELYAMKRKLSDSFDWLESGDWALGDFPLEDLGKPPGPSE